MMTPTLRTIPYILNGAFYSLAVTGWGDPSAQPVVAVHGLSRNARDFDTLAQALADRFHVIAVDLPGRGGSGWLADPAAYQPLSYVQALSHVLAHVGRPVFWIGTSLGGICGMLMAAASGAPISRMVLNDVGPHIPAAALARIRDYIGRLPSFAGLGEADAYLREVHAAFGNLSDAQWRHMAETSTRTLPDGRLALHFDPALTRPIMAAEPADMNLWPVWDRIDIPMLVIRGASSDLLLAETCERMSAKAEIHIVEGAGHAPALMDAPTIAVIRDFLIRP